MNKLKNKVWGLFCSLAIFAVPLLVSATELYSPIDKSTSVPTLIGKVLSVVVGVVGAIALAFFIYGGFQWMTSAGDGKKVSSGKDTMVWAILGLVIIFSARAILTFVLGSLTGSK